MRRLALALVPLALAAALAATPVLAQDFHRGTISITGHGEISAAPDTAFIMSGVTTQGATAREALDANNEAMTALIAALKAAGIEERDIQTSGFSVTPNYVYTQEVDENGYTLPPKISGYTVFNNVNVRVRDIAKVGAVLDQAVTVGANTINGVSFSVADPSRLLDEARQLAFTDALRKARLYADAARVDLDRVYNISEGVSYGQPIPYGIGDRAEFAASPVPVQTGELTFAIDVNVTWEID